MKIEESYQSTMTEVKYDLCTMGEVLLRLSEEDNEVISRGKILHKEAVGSEMNIAAGASLLGLKTAFYTKLPDNDVGQFVLGRLRNFNISEEYLQWDGAEEARLGVFYYEGGSDPRKPRVVYDRGRTSFWGIDYGGKALFKESVCFHTCGITLALCKNTREAAWDLIKGFKQGGAIVSFDVNYRGNLWSGREARECITTILPYVDVLFCSEDTARLTFEKQGTLGEIMKSFCEEYPLKAVISTQRIVHSTKCHTFGSVIFDAVEKTFYEEPPYDRIEVVDRVGSGDAFISGILYGMVKYPGDWQKALEYGNASGAVNHTLKGDLPALNKERLEAVIRDHKKPGEKRELDR